ncbi:IS110 family transposase, partial [Methylocystis parvus]
MTTSQPITTIGLDLAKSVFQVHAIDETGQVIQRRTIRRSQVLKFFQSLPPCLVGMEACASAHHWARELELLGHRVRIMPPAYVKPYVKRNKTDAADAEAICEAVTRPTMRFVPIKSAEQQADGMVIKTRNLLIKQRSQSANALRAHMAELGIVAATGMASIAKLIERLRDLAESSIPAAARLALDELAGQIEMLTKRIEALDREIMIAVKNDPEAKRLTSIPGVGPMIAATVKPLCP